MTVKQAQNLLQYLGYYTGIPDGDWGPLSEKATRAFQDAFDGLAVTGQLNDETRKALKHAVAYGMPVREPEKASSFWDEIKYFRRDEPYIGCPCGACGGFPVEPSERLMRATDSTRGHFGVPMIPTSTVRCKAHNAAVQGVYNSRHLEGRAMDFIVQGVSGARVLEYVLTLGPSYAYRIKDKHGNPTDAVHMDF